MAITQAICTSFKTELLGGTHDLDTDTCKMALYLSSASLDASTTAYTATGETSGTNYTAGGVNLSGGAISSSGTTAFVDWSDATFTNVTVTWRGAMIYNSSKANRAICIIDGGIDRTATAQTITAVFPSADASNAIIRIA